MLEKILDNYYEENILLIDGYDDAVVGICPNSLRLIYSIDFCLDILHQTGMSEDDAIEHFQYNVMGSYVGNQTPIFLETFQ